MEPVEEPRIIERTEEREVAVFRGDRYRRYPKAKRREQATYFFAWTTEKKLGRLHQEVWKAHYGAIPDGYEIHHFDGDPSNNTIGNLRCVTSGEHKRLDHQRRGGLTERQRAHLERVLPLARAAQQTPEFRARLSERAKKQWKDPPTASYVCEQCGEGFNAVALGTQNRFCSNKCKSAWRRASGVDDEQRTCGWCGGEFAVNRYSKAENCSRSCAASACHARARLQFDGGEYA
jgi:predicted nucleic acid-binding Zn ribbon protein